MSESTLSSLNQKIVDSAIARIPSVENILKEAMAAVPAEKLDPTYIATHFSELANIFEKAAYKIYLEHERMTIPFMAEHWACQNLDLIEKMNKELNSVKFAEEICVLFAPLAREIEFRAGQMRKSRGGKSFERIVEVLLNRLGLSCQRPTKKPRKTLKRIDLVVPNQQLALARPDQAFFLSCKRTLRERWKQTIPERKPSWRVFLLTLDEELPEEKAKEIDQLGIIAYVKDEVKSKPHLADKEWIRSLSDLPKDLGAS